MTQRPAPQQRPERPASRQRPERPASRQRPERPAPQATLPVPNMSIRNLPEFLGFQLEERVQAQIDGVWKNGTIINYDVFNFMLYVKIDGVGTRKIKPSDLRKIESDEESDSESHGEQTPEATELLNLVENLQNFKIHKLIDKMIADGNFDSIINLRNSSKENLLHILAHDDANFSLVKSLFDFNIKIDINAINVDGDTPLIFAAAENSQNIAKYLINRGADVNKYNEVPPLYLFSQFLDGYELVKLLIEKGANVNATDTDGETPLFAAANRGSIDTVKLLLDSGANTKIKNNNGKTAADVADTQEKRKMIEDASVFTFPHTTVNRNNIPAEAKDIINATDENISQFIAANPRNKIFKFMDAYHAINADDFESYFLQGEKKNENTFYSCKRVISGLGVGVQDVNANKPLFSLRNLGFTDYVSMDEFESALQSPNQYFEIIREGADIAPSISSYYSIHGRSNADFNLSSRLHCQEGIQSKIYKLAILDIVSTGGKKNKTKKQINNLIKRKTQNKNKNKKV